MNKNRKYAIILIIYYKYYINIHYLLSYKINNFYVNIHYF